MPIRHLPRTVMQRQAAMHFIKNRLDAAPGQPDPFHPNAVARLMALCPQYDGLVQARSNAKANHSTKVREVKVLRMRAVIWLSHGFASVINATVRGIFPKGVLILYGLPAKAKGGPRMKSMVEIMNASEALVKGEAARVAAGGQPITFPSEAEIMVHAYAFIDAYKELSTLKSALIDANRALRSANAEANRLILRLWNEVETDAYTSDLPKMRARARLWGVVYGHSPKEPPSAETSSAMGHITDSATGKALRSVVVTVAGTDIRVRSSARGRYALPLLESGEHTVQFKLKGYETEERIITAALGQMAVEDVGLVAK